MACCRIHRDDRRGQPGDRRAADPGAARRRGRRRRRARRGRECASRLACCQPGGASRAAAALGGRRRPARNGDRGAGVDRRRPPLRGPASAGRDAAVHRGTGRQAPRRVTADAHSHEPGTHRAGAVRRRRRDHPVERSRADVRPGRGSGHRRRQHDRRQTGRGRPIGVSRAGSPRRGGGHPARRGQRRHRLRPRGRSGARRGSADPPAQLHRLPSHRRGCHGCLREEPDAAPSRARRQVATRRVRRRRPGQGGAGDRPRHHHEQRPDLHGRLACGRGAVHPCRAGRAAHRRHRTGERRSVGPARPDGTAGQRPAARAGPRLHRGGPGGRRPPGRRRRDSEPARRTTTATSSSRPCSTTSTRSRGSPRRRSSARSCR